MKNIFDLNKVMALEEKNYSNCVLNKITLKYDENDIDQLKYVDAEFTVAGRQVRDRFFSGSDQRLQAFVGSMYPYTDKGQLSLDEWHNIPCSVGIQYHSYRGYENIQTRDWQWDGEYIDKQHVAHQGPLGPLAQALKENPSSEDSFGNPFEDSDNKVSLEQQGKDEK